MRQNITSMVKTIKISDDIHSRLLKVGSMGETFEDVIKKLLDFYENKAKK
jgi:predicted CopG family antitoxin